jgi:hypothetical protein
MAEEVTKRGHPGPRRPGRITVAIGGGDALAPAKSGRPPGEECASFCAPIPPDPARRATMGGTAAGGRRAPCSPRSVASVAGSPWATRGQAHRRLEHGVFLTFERRYSGLVRLRKPRRLIESIVSSHSSPVHGIVCSSTALLALPCVAATSGGRWFCGRPK